MADTSGEAEALETVYKAAFGMKSIFSVVLVSPKAELGTEDI
jgi:hypothetical protein